MPADKNNSNFDHRYSGYGNGGMEDGRDYGSGYYSYNINKNRNVDYRTSMGAQSRNSTSQDCRTTSANGTERGYNSYNSGRGSANSNYVTTRRREYTDPAYGIYDDAYAVRKSRSTSNKNNNRKKRKKIKVKPELMLYGVAFVAVIVLIIILISAFARSISKKGNGNETTPVTTAAVTTDSGFADTQPETPSDTDPAQTPKFYSVPEVSFKADLSAYEKYMSPDDRDGYLLLVNAKNTLSSDYEPSRLVDLDKSILKNSSSDVKMVEEAANALEALFIEMKANGYTDIKVTNAYRSYSYQKWLFNYWNEEEKKAHPDWSDEEVEKEVLTYSNREGTSEHQSGLCCDMHNLSETSWERAKEFADSPSGSWLIENCWKFGFVLRFPDGKQEECLGVRYESWHYRYVGRYHAYQMKMLNMCLEEYIQYLEQ